MPKLMPSHPLILVGDTPEVLARAIDDGVSAAACYRMKIPPTLKDKLAKSIALLTEISWDLPYTKYSWGGRVSGAFGKTIMDDGYSIYIDIAGNGWDQFKSMALSHQPALTDFIISIQTLDGRISKATKRGIIGRQIRLESKREQREDRIHLDGDAGIAGSKRLLWTIVGNTTEGFINDATKRAHTMRCDSFSEEDCFCFPDDSVIWLGNEQRGLAHRAPTGRQGQRFLYLPSLGPKYRWG